MTIKFECSCGRWMQTHDKFAGRRCHCPTCDRVVQIPEAGEIGDHAAAERLAEVPSASEPFIVREFLDPPETSDATGSPETSSEGVSVFRRMFEALLDPRSIQWIMMIGGGLSVLGLVIWLISLGIFKDPLILAVVMGIGTLAVLGAGWFVTLRTKYHMAGQALTFLGCVVAPLNLWFYHAQGLITVDGRLWVGGVICCLLYAVTVVVLRDPLFMYAFEAGATLTLLLLLADLGRITDVTYLSLFLMVMGLASIHGERAFSTSDDDTFTRQKFGLPLFWAGHVQMAVSLLLVGGNLCVLVLRHCCAKDRLLSGDCRILVGDGGSDIPLRN